MSTGSAICPVPAAVILRAFGNHAKNIAIAMDNSLICWRMKAGTGYIMCVFSRRNYRSP
jgi:hypothetical protein